MPKEALRLQIHVDARVLSHRSRFFTFLQNLRRFYFHFLAHFLNFFSSQDPSPLPCSPRPSLSSPCVRACVAVLLEVMRSQAVRESATAACQVLRAIWCMCCDGCPHGSHNAAALGGAGAASGESPTLPRSFPSLSHLPPQPL
jgi:hypothetical protein